MGTALLLKMNNNFPSSSCNDVCEESMRETVLIFLQFSLIQFNSAALLCITMLVFLASCFWGKNYIIVSSVCRIQFYPEQNASLVIYFFINSQILRLGNLWIFLQQWSIRNVFFLTIFLTVCISSVHLHPLPHSHKQIISIFTLK